MSREFGKIFGTLLLIAVLFNQTTIVVTAMGEMVSEVVDEHEVVGEYDDEIVEDEKELEYEFECEEGLITIEQTSECIATTFAQLNNYVTGAPTDGTLRVIYLANHLPIAGHITVGSGRNIEIRGLSINGERPMITHGGHRHFTVSGGAHLHLVNLELNGANVNNDNNHGVVIGSNGSLEITDTIIRNQGRWGVWDYGGDFIFNSGQISYNAGGGVRLGGRAGAVATMNGGTISENRGLGVHAGAYSYFIMNAGWIVHNTATNGAGILIGGENGGPGRVTVNGGIIAFNTATNNGGGVHVRSITMPDPAAAELGDLTILHTSFQMNGGAIISNRANNNGGGIYVGHPTIHLPLPTIPAGGLPIPLPPFSLPPGVAGEIALVNMALLTLEHAEFTLNNATIDMNVAGNFGGGVYLGYTDATATSGSTTLSRRIYAYLNVTGNTRFENNHAGEDGGAIFVSNYQYAYTLTTGAFSQLTTAVNTVFTNNVAGNGGFRPPGNPQVTSILASSTSIFNHPLNNHDINFRFDNYWEVNFNVGPGASDAPPTQHLPDDPNWPAERPADPIRPGNNFMGWFVCVPGTNTPDLDNPFDFNTQITQDYNLCAHWEPEQDDTSTGGGSGGPGAGTPTEPVVPNNPDDENDDNGIDNELELPTDEEDSNEPDLPSVPVDSTPPSESTVPETPESLPQTSVDHNVFSAVFGIGLIIIGMMVIGVKRHEKKTMQLQSLSNEN